MRVVTQLSSPAQDILPSEGEVAACALNGPRAIPSPQQSPQRRNQALVKFTDKENRSAPVAKVPEQLPD